MKPLLFAFKEPATESTLDFSAIEYDDILNLNVFKNTGMPAIDSLSTVTETMTKDFGEGSSDSDHTGLNVLMETETRTFTSSESSDSDANRFAGSLMDTMTATRVFNEDSDSDNGR